MYVWWKFETRAAVSSDGMLSQARGRVASLVPEPAAEGALPRGLHASTFSSSSLSLRQTPSYEIHQHHRRPATPPPLVIQSATLGDNITDTLEPPRHRDIDITAPDKDACAARVTGHLGDCAKPPFHTL